MIYEIHLIDISDFSKPNPDGTVKDAIRCEVNNWRAARLGFSRAEDDLKRNIYDVLQARAYRTIQELRSRPLSEKLRPHTLDTNETQVRPKRALKAVKPLNRPFHLRGSETYPSEMKAKARRAQMRLVI